MASYKPTNLQPVCKVPGCKEGASILSLSGTIAKWMLTCRRHHAGMVPKQGTKTA